MGYINENEREYHAIVTHKSGTLIVDRLPSWIENGDVIIQLNGKTYIQSLTQHETRWQRLLR